MVLRVATNFLGSILFLTAFTTVGKLSTFDLTYSIAIPSLLTL